MAGGTSLAILNRILEVHLAATVATHGALSFINRDFAPAARAICHKFDDAARVDRLDVTTC
jgi:hypothetical protein